MRSLLASVGRCPSLLSKAPVAHAFQHAAAAMSSAAAAALSFDKHGDPAAVLQLRQPSKLPERLGDTDVELQVLMVRVVQHAGPTKGADGCTC